MPAFLKMRPASSFPLKHSACTTSTISRAQQFFASRAALSTTSRPLAAATSSGGQVSQIAKAEQGLTGQSGPVPGGPAAQAQSAAAAGQPLSGHAVSDIARAERDVTGEAAPRRGGPAAAAQSSLTKDDAARAPQQQQQQQATGTLDSATIRRIHDAEKAITGDDAGGPVKGGPTAAAQSHAGEGIGSASLHDITEGEKNITGGERVKGGPTATAQSELGKSRS